MFLANLNQYVVSLKCSRTDIISRPLVVTKYLSGLIITLSLTNEIVILSAICMLMLSLY